jgi:xylulokinase
MTTLLGFDIGSSSIKATLLDVERGTCLASATSPEGSELPMKAEKIGWAEQDPELWWEHVTLATAKLRALAPEGMKEVGAIGISYQMHGLVLVDKENKPVRPSIIWCDSRAVEIGNRATKALGERACLSDLLNTPGNFTASKLRWVMEHEPAVFERAVTMMLPGDYIALKLSGEKTTTPSGLSEGMLWSYPANDVSTLMLNHYEIDRSLIPEYKPTFSIQSQVSKQAAALLGIPAGIPISYRAGDQPNNAYSLNVLNPGEFATTAGTSGVIYGVGDTPAFDAASRVNTFVHVTHDSKKPRYGTLLCCNGTGILYRWVRAQAGDNLPYVELNKLAASVAPGSDGLNILPYGNGAERSLENKNPGAALLGINFNTHTKAHLLRAAQEGIVYSLKYGLDVMHSMGLSVKTVRAGHANLFLSPLFREVFATVTGATVELFDTDGAQGAARGAGVGAGIYASHAEAFKGLTLRERIEPNRAQAAQYQDFYEQWCSLLKRVV